MLSTYEEIEAEWERLVAQSRKPFPPEARATMTAFMQHTAGLPITASCIHCGRVLAVTDLGKHGQAWSVTCPCGRSKDTLKGL